MYQSTRTTVADCRDYCQNEQSCFGFDWERSTQRCYSHFSQSNLALDKRFQNDDIDLYVKNCGKRYMYFSCPNIYSHRMNELLTINKAVHIFVSDCEDNFVIEINQNAPGAAEDTSANTESQCRTSCLSKTILECAAYEFDLENNRCWIHGSTPASLNPANGVDHYARLQCIDPGR